MTRAVLFDLDDTLFDHRGASRAALAAVHRRHAGATDFEAFEEHHARILEELHLDVLAGTRGLDEARRERFRRVFEAIGIALSDAEADAVAAAYRAGYVPSWRAVEGAAELVAAIRAHARVGVISNNLIEETRDKLAFCDIAPLVDAVVVSGDEGISKPDPRIFHVALERLSVDAGEAVMFGDSWTADIVGAARAGIRAVWFNPRRQPRPADPPRVEEVFSLTPIDRLVARLVGEPGNAEVRIGVDFGGTKIEAIALDAAGRERARRRIATPREDYDASVRAVAGLVEAIEQEVGERGSVGVGIPGAISPATGLVKNANSTWLIGRPLDRDLARALDRPVRTANDANCFALSEATDGAGAGTAIVFGVILGTGVGGGVVVDGRVLAGANAVAGEWGHNALPWPDDTEWPGPPCYCGKRGCIETFLSGHGLQLAYGSADPPAAQAIAAAAAAGDARAAAAMRVYVRRLAKALATIVNVLDPDIIVLGGGLSNIEALYARVPVEWSDWVFSDRVVTRLERARHGDSSGVRGAAWLWPA